MERKEELLKLVESSSEQNKKIIFEIIDVFIFLEEQLKELRKLPMIMVNKSNPALQKPTSAAKLYKEFLVQYSNLVKIFLKTLGEEVADEENSPLDEFFKKQEEFFKNGVK